MSKNARQRRKIKKNEAQKRAKEKLEKLLSSLPTYVYNGPKIEIVQPGQHFSNVMNILSKQTVVGFDTETQVEFDSKENNKIALIQIACDDCVFLFHFPVLGTFTALQDFLSGPCFKVGVGLENDILDLKVDHNLDLKTYIDLTNFAKGLGISPFSTQALFAKYYNLRLTKSRDCTFSRWNRPVLKEHQIQYACEDVWSGLLIYRGMFKSLPKP